MRIRCSMQAFKLAITRQLPLLCKVMNELCFAWSLELELDTNPEEVADHATSASTITTANHTESTPLVYINGVPASVSPAPLATFEQPEKLRAKLSKFFGTIPSKLINLISMTMKQRMRSKKTQKMTTSDGDDDVSISAAAGAVARAAERAARQEVGVSTWVAPADW